MSRRGVQVAPNTFANFIQANQAFDETIFLAAHILNEIQNGPRSEAYENFVSKCDASDTVVTFNWDTLLDRAFANSGRWNPDDGYGVRFESLLDGQWRAPTDQPSSKLLKLHGSTNWLVHYVTRHLTSGERGIVSRQGLEPGRIGLTLEWNFERQDDELHLDPRVRRDDRGITPVPPPPDPDSFPVCVQQGEYGQPAADGAAERLENCWATFPERHPVEEA